MNRDTKTKLIVNSIRWIGVILGLIMALAMPALGLLVAAALFGFAHLMAIMATPTRVASDGREALKEAFKFAGCEYRCSHCGTIVATPSHDQTK